MKITASQQQQHQSHNDSNDNSDNGNGNNNNNNSRLKQLIESGFHEKEDLDEALSIIESCGAYEHAKMLARHEGDVALQQLECLPESEAKESLKRMVDYVLTRMY